MQFTNPDMSTEVMTNMAQASQAGLQVLEFDLGDETYCVEIHYVAEIVDKDDLTAVPNTPAHVEGVMDLRGRTTSIVDPKVVFDIEKSGDEKRIIVFDPEELDSDGAIGWVVDEVDQVVDIPEEAIDTSTVTDDDAIRGIVRREDSFVVWVDPEAVSA